MKKVLFIINKYIGVDDSEYFFPDFLINFQTELLSHDVELSYVFFSKNLKDINVQNKFIYDQEKFIHFTKKDISIQAKRIEKEYGFTFKQSFFPDILQTFKGQDGTILTPPEFFFNELKPLVTKFLYLEALIKKNNFDIIFSDVSPEYEMEFGRIIGNKLNKIVLKEYLGAALGNSVILKCNNFGNFEWIEAQGDEKFDLENTKLFIENFIALRKAPYQIKPKLSIFTKFYKKIKNSDLSFYSKLPLKISNFLLNRFSNYCNSLLKSKFIYKKFDQNTEFIFFGLHLMTESTVTYKAMPFTNQISFIEILSRALPFNHVLYVREHPHWPEIFTYKFLLKIKDFPNVRVISPEISIHDILSSCNGVITLTNTTGIEALIYGKPVLSFASNIYTGYHSSALKCANLFQLGKNLTELINTKVSQKETISFVNRIRNNSTKIPLTSSSVNSLNESKIKAKTYANYLIKVFDKLSL
jgi:hypothetical protein